MMFHQSQRQTSFVLIRNYIGRYNFLLLSIKSSLVDLQKGIKGLVVMSSELEEIFTCVYDGRVPSGWLKGKHDYEKSIYSYFSLG